MNFEESSQGLIKVLSGIYLEEPRETKRNFSEYSPYPSQDLKKAFLKYTIMFGPTCQVSFDLEKQFLG
jgi:hypothetical protein